MARYNIFPNQETIRDYVLPYIKGKSSDIIAKLRQANVSLGASGSSMVHLLLSKGEIEEAAIIISKVPAYYYPEGLKKPLTQAFYNTKDLKSYTTIVRHLYENHDRKEVVKENSDTLDKNELVGKLILELSNNTNMFISVSTT